jgi:hypothetical protein
MIALNNSSKLPVFSLLYGFDKVSIVRIDNPKFLSRKWSVHIPGITAFDVATKSEKERRSFTLSNRYRQLS